MMLDILKWQNSFEIKKETDVFGIRDIEGYMAGHRGLAGLALKRARSPTDEGGDRKRFKSAKPSWQVYPL